MASANSVEIYDPITDSDVNSNLLTITAGSSMNMNQGSGQISIQGSTFLKADSGITTRSVYAKNGVQIDADYDDNGGGDNTAQN